MRYFIRATLRSARLPKSRCTLTIAMHRSTTRVGLDVAHRQRDGRERLLRAGRDAEAAADQHVVADDVPVLADRQQAEVVGVHVDAVVARQADGHLELPRQIGLAVDRLDRIMASVAAGLTAPFVELATSWLSPVSSSVSQIS